VDEELLTQARSRVGTVLRGKYRIDGLLGVGGMAVVYAATHRNKKRFAIKVLHPELSMRSQVRARFLREGYAANSVGHAGAVTVLDDDVDDDGRAFLVMELLDGADLESLRERAGGRLPLQQSLAVVHELLDVLDAAHRHAIVHRDIKPANLLVLREGRLKVLDFGIARLRDAASKERMTQTGVTLGTPAFMAPEQAQGQDEEVDAQTDLWAAGATLFTVLSGRAVHEGSSSQQVLVRAATSRAPSLAVVAPEMPASVVRIVAKALAFDKAERWTAAAAMREALAEAYVERFADVPLTEALASLGSAIAEPHGMHSTVRQAAPSPAAEPPDGAAGPSSPADTSNLGLATTAASTMPPVRPPLEAAAPSPHANGTTTGAGTAAAQSQAKLRARPAPRARARQIAILAGIAGAVALVAAWAPQHVHGTAHGTGHGAAASPTAADPVRSAPPATDTARTTEPEAMGMTAISEPASAPAVAAARTPSSGSDPAAPAPPLHLPQAARAGTGAGAPVSAPVRLPASTSASATPKPSASPARSPLDMVLQ
jgi:serine/threonine-protein kinase